MQFDPNDMATVDSGLFGLPFTRDQARVCLIPVPWEVTTSYGDGTSRGPEKILAASHQIDLFDIETGDVYKHGYYMEPIPKHILELNDEDKKRATALVAALESSGSLTPQNKRIQDSLNQNSDTVNEWVYESARSLLNSGKIVGVIGGDHSSPYGAIRAISEFHHADFGILHIDAHADLRHAYQGFTHSHASIMFNVMESDFRPKKLVQVGIRDFSPQEYDYINARPNVIKTWFDPLMKRKLNAGKTWQSMCDEIIADLPQKVYISFDIDGLSPELCPGTGTPVPGGLSFDQALTLLATIAESGRRIIGFDLCEVAQPDEDHDEWNGNVGARILFKLCGWTMITNGFSPGRIGRT